MDRSKPLRNRVLPLLAHTYIGEDEGKKVRAHRDVLEELKMVAREVGMEQVEKGIHNHFMEGWGNFMEVLQRRGGNRLTRWKYDEGVAVENYDEE